MNANTYKTNINDSNVLNDEQTTSTNNWGAKLKSSNFHLGLDLQLSMFGEAWR